MPTVEVSASGPSTTTITADQADQLTYKNFKAVGKYLSQVKMTNLNCTNGSATITAASESDVLSADFSRLYTVSINGDEALKSKQALTNLSMEFMPLSVDKDAVSLRALYTDGSTDEQFHSRHSTSTVTVDGFSSFPAPGEGMTPNPRFVLENTDNGQYTYGIYISDLNVNLKDAEDTGLNYYVDFDITINGVKQDVEILTTDCATYQTWKNSVKGIEKTNVSDNVWDWSTQFKNICNNSDGVPVFIHNVETVNNTSDLKELDVKVNFYTVYPFLYDEEAPLQSSAAPRRVSTTTIASDKNLSTFKVSNTSSSFATSGTALTTDIISGIDDILYDNDFNAPVEYYTISGIRVVGTPAPGIYIRRQGNTVSKVAIR
jgi:hypothetical protein